MVTANIWLDNGECLEQFPLPGNVSYSSSIESIELQHKSRVIRIEFNDSSSDEDGDERDVKDEKSIFSIADSLLNFASPLPSANINDQGELNAFQSMKEWTKEDKKGSMEDRGLEAFASSLWDTVDSVTSHNQETPKNSLLREITSETVLKRYENFIPVVSVDRSRVEEVREGMRRNNRGSTQSTSSLQLPFSRKPSAESTFQESDFAIEKHQALQVRPY